MTKEQNKENPAADEIRSADASLGKEVIIKEADLLKLQKEAAEYKDKNLRLYAEFENTRKRLERDKQEFAKYANEEVIVEFLGILDDLERTIDAARAKHTDDTAFVKGIEMVMTHIHGIFKKYGVTKIEAKGKMFDPHCHEVLMQEETSQAPEGIVLEEFQKGYYLGEKVVRTAKVKIAKAKQSDPTGSEDKKT